MTAIIGRRRPNSDADTRLTARERQAITLLAAGLTAQQIADQMCISLNTGKIHIGNAYAKLGARNGPHAVALAIRTGQIDGTDGAS